MSVDLIAALLLALVLAIGAAWLACRPSPSASAQAERDARDQLARANRRRPMPKLPASYPPAARASCAVAAIEPALTRAERDVIRLQASAAAARSLAGDADACTNPYPRATRKAVAWAIDFAEARTAMTWTRASSPFSNRSTAAQHERQS